MTAIGSKPVARDTAATSITALAAFLFVLWTCGSYARWANYEYRTFDLAFYVQGLWQFLHGRFAVSVEHVPLMGNHVEPIVFLIAPFFAIFRHPMTLVVVQNAALATMGPVGFDIGKRLGFGAKESWFLAAALLLTPAAGYIALHEFHPEALSAPLLLLMFRARLLRSLTQHWFWFVAVLACKENMAPLLIAYCAVHAAADRKRGLAEVRAWYLWPMGLALLWLALCTSLITPALNSGNVDYIVLYERLGSSASDILLNTIREPRRITLELFQSLSHGNLVWALLFPFLCLPLLAPRWLLIAAPILLQHLLSWRSSEWMIYFHYGAPLLPLFWIAAVEGVANLDRRELLPASVRRAVPLLLVLAALLAQIILGPAASLASTAANWFTGKEHRARRNAIVAEIPPAASVIAPFPYLSHLAMREQLYSLHYVLKGLKTLSRASYEPPPPTDFVLIDYRDAATFDASAGYYHPAMKTKDGQVVPSSDRLLHDLLKQRSWVVTSTDELSLLRQGKREVPPARHGLGPIVDLGRQTQLLSISKSGELLSKERPLEIRMVWNFQDERDVFPWLVLALVSRQNGERTMITRGLCAPEARAGFYEETWHITSPDRFPTGDYSAEAFFVDHSRGAWSDARDGNPPPRTLLSKPVPIGNVRVSTER
jgi:uncharacterized membrane protein